MEFEITPVQKFCNFDKTPIYIFIPQDESYGFNPCKSCVFRGDTGVFGMMEECYHLPCDSLHKSDKNNGFWAICLNVDYQAFTKMLPVGG